MLNNIRCLLRIGSGQRVVVFTEVQKTAAGEPEATQDFSVVGEREKQGSNELLSMVPGLDLWRDR